MSVTNAAFIHSPQFEQYRYPPDHPFRTARAKMARDILLSIGLLSGDGQEQPCPSPAGRDDLLKFHTAAYLDALRSAARKQLGIEALRMGIGTPDCPIFEGMYEYAALACGGSLLAAALIARGRADVAFNPSGGYHHAHPARAAGFCYLNDVVLACMALADAGMKVALVDVDAHHADGVQAAFYDRADVMTISLHESGRTLFPGTGFVDEIGRGRGEGYSVNVPLPAGTYDEAYLRAFKELAVPLIGAFGPDAIVLELGMDALAGDPLAHLGLTNNTHAEVIELLSGFGKPILATGGGGYNIDNTARGWALAWCVLAGRDESHDAAGLDGVMLENAEWQGGLRDRRLAVSDDQRKAVGPAIDAVIRAVKEKVFPIHGLKP